MTRHREASVSEECGSIVDVAEQCESVASSDLLLVLDECRNGRNLVGPFGRVEELMVSLNNNEGR